VSHFLTQCLFCFFAEDVGLLPERLRAQLAKLFETMREGGLFPKRTPRGRCRLNWSW
jgi:hypothetical protein